MPRLQVVGCQLQDMSRCARWDARRTVAAPFIKYRIISYVYNIPAAEKSQFYLEIALNKAAEWLP